MSGSSSSLVSCVPTSAEGKSATGGWFYSTLSGIQPNLETETKETVTVGGQCRSSFNTTAFSPADDDGGDADSRVVLSVCLPNSQ